MSAVTDACRPADRMHQVCVDVAKTVAMLSEASIRWPDADYYRRWAKDIEVSARQLAEALDGEVQSIRESEVQ